MSLESRCREAGAERLRFRRSCRGSIAAVSMGCDRRV